MSRLLLVVVALLALAAPASADPPARLPGQITDSGGALGGGRAEVQAAIDRLYDEHRLRLWVVYVDGFDGVGGTDWAERTADVSALGERDVLLAVATADREYSLYSPGLPDEVTDAEFADVRAERVEPALRGGDWAGAAVAAADGLGSAMAPRAAGAGGWTLWVIIGLALVGGVGVWWYARRKRAQRTSAGLAQARRTDDPAVLAGLPDEALDARSRELLVEVDNALRASVEELELATGEFGEARTRPFTEACAHARAALAAAFAIRQRLDDSDDDVPETPQQRRDLLIELITGLSSADAELDARVAEFDALRDLLIDAPNRLAALTERVVALTVRLPESRAALARLAAEFPARAVAPVADNVTMAEQHLSFAEKSIADGRAAVARPAGEQGEAVAAIRAAEGAVGQAAALLDAVDRAAEDIRTAVSSLPAAIEALRADIAEAERRGDVDPATVSAAKSALTTDQTTPLTAYATITAADADLDAAIAAAGERRRRADLLTQTTAAATAQLTAAEDFIAARRGAVGAQARTRLAEARRHLDATRTADPDAAQRHAQWAMDLARRAAAEAESDVRRWESSRTTGGGDLGATLGGILIGGMLGGGRSSGRSPGRSRGGHRPASFGGTRGTRRHGGGGRF
ncbi:TPM domain-containing protein [Actinokineospora guangxiensis]|uniref:TPM domain-containing protein n=1 Tax=Actinokineospora guangxiensis TaxID=1490288 RepID=A0ABW0EEY4_9PSEU